MKTKTISIQGKNAGTTSPAPSKTFKKRMPRQHYKHGITILDPKKCRTNEGHIEPISDEVRSVLYR